MDGTTKIKEKCLILQGLKDKFEENIKQYHSELYDEANTRLEFIDKFFVLLDWDVYNEQGFSNTCKEVFALVDSEVAKLNAKLDGKHKKLGELFKIGKGMETVADDVFCLMNILVNF